MTQINLKSQFPWLCMESGLDNKKLIESSILKEPQQPDVIGVWHPLPLIWTDDMQKKRKMQSY